MSAKDNGEEVLPWDGELPPEDSSGSLATLANLCPRNPVDMVLAASVIQTYHEGTLLDDFMAVCGQASHDALVRMGQNPPPVGEPVPPVPAPAFPEAAPGVMMMPLGVNDNLKPPELKASFLQPLNSELQERVAEMTHDAKNLELVPVSYKTQVDAGTNYFVKYRIGSSNDFIHARVYQDFSGNKIYKLVSVSNIKSEADPITSF